MPLVFILSATAILAIGLVPAASNAMISAILLAGLGTMGAQMGSNAFAMFVYPTALRASGLGWALSMGRIGSVIGPLLGGALLAWNRQPSQLFLVIGCIALLPALVFLVIGQIAARRQQHGEVTIGT
jgi:AAHS family 4-hydroxybenzoate transporter-like MFS transporter